VPKKTWHGQKSTTATGFEPVRANPADNEMIRVCRLNHSANFGLGQNLVKYGSWGMKLTLSSVQIITKIGADNVYIHFYFGGRGALIGPEGA
jgi:hypothetical protein